MIDTGLDYGSDYLCGKVTNYYDSKNPINYSTYAHDVRKNNPNLTRKEISNMMVTTINSNIKKADMVGCGIDSAISIIANMFKG